MAPDLEPRIGTLERTFLAASEALRQRLADEEAERQRREAEAIERIKQKSIEARDALLLAVAGAHRDDPTTAATLLREVRSSRDRDRGCSSPWIRCKQRLWGARCAGMSLMSTPSP